MTAPHPTIRPQPGIREIALYVGGEATLAGHAAPLKLSSNENPFGPSPRALAAFRAAADRLHIYPDTGHAALRRRHRRGPRARRRSGSSAASARTRSSRFLAQGYAGPGDEVIHTEHGFGMYRISALGAGATPGRGAARPSGAPTSTPSSRPAPRAPGWCSSPTPTTRPARMIPEAEVARLAEGLPPAALLVLDGAYADYVEGFDGHAALGRRPRQRGR